MFKCHEIWQAENRWNRALFIRQKNSPASQTVATAWIALKICQDQPSAMCSNCSKFHPNRLTFGGVNMAKRVNTAKLHRRINPIFGWSPASSRIISRNGLDRNPVKKSKPTVGYEVNMSELRPLWSVETCDGSALMAGESRALLVFTSAINTPTITPDNSMHYYWPA